MTEAARALHRYAPTAERDLRRMEVATWSEAQLADLTDLTELTARVCAVQHATEPLTPPGGGPGSGGRYRWQDTDAADWLSLDDLSRRDRAALDFATQCSVDVSAVTDAQRSELFDQLGGSAVTFAAMVFVLDFLPRTRAALTALFDGAGEANADAKPVIGEPDGPAPGIWEALDSFTRTVPGLGALDPVTTELVRLRGARQHRCRICSSLRSRPALLAGAGTDEFAAVDDYRTSDLPADQKAALAFCDAMLWTPGRIDPEVAGPVIALMEPDQRVELVLDITRNALNKVAVALAADAPHVEDGIEIFDVDANGDLLYGLSIS